jgi:hypothetical protein
MPKTCPESATSGSDSSWILAPATPEPGVVQFMGGQRRVEAVEAPTARVVVPDCVAQKESVPSSVARSRLSTPAKRMTRRTPGETPISRKVTPASLVFSWAVKMA